jgi:hypothetical protein
MVFQKLFRTQGSGELGTGRQVGIASVRKARPRDTGSGLRFRTGRSAARGAWNSFAFGCLAGRRSALFLLAGWQISHEVAVEAVGRERFADLILAIQVNVRTES